MSRYDAQVIPQSGVPNGHIRENSFPKLKSVLGHHFEYAFAFHGWNEDSICIEGSAPPTKLGACCSVFGTAAGKMPIPASNCDEVCICDRR